MRKTEKLIDWQENERKDRNRNGLDDRIEPPIPDVSQGSKRLSERLRDDGLADSKVTGGDLDARWEAAQFTGDETPISSMSSPDANVVEDIGASIGINYAADEELKAGEKERERDRHRWELDPASSEDYQDRSRER